MFPRWLRGETNPDLDAGRLFASGPASAELSEIVGTLLAQTATLEAMIEPGEGTEESQGGRDTIAEALERTRARVADAQQVLNEGQVVRRVG